MESEELKDEAKNFASALKEEYSQGDSSKKQRNILIVVILLLLCGVAFGYQQYMNLRVDLNIAEQNTAALADSVRTTNNKNGDLEYSKKLLVADKNNLKELSKELDEELKKEKGKVHQLTKYIVSIQNKPADTVRITNTLIEYADGSSGLKWKHDTIYEVVRADGSIDTSNSRHIAGTSKFMVDTTTGFIKPLETIITRDDINFNIIQGMREVDGHVEMFVRSDYPGFGVNDLQSAIIDPQNHPVLKKYTKQKRWGLGPMVGVGLGINLWPNQDIGVGVFVGISVHYSLFQF